MRILSVVGARPQFVKLATVSLALQAAGHHHVIVHTGQHYDPRLSDVFFEQLNIPTPDVQLGVGSDRHGAQTGRMLTLLEVVLDERRPDWVLVYGDTNSTLAAALAAVKLCLPLAHLEAGLRSFNRQMPEEHNRVLTDHAADLLLAPTTLAMVNLNREGLAARSVLVGDVTTDICLSVRDQVGRVRPHDVRRQVGDDPFVLATMHRQENTDDKDQLGRWINALRGLDLPVLLSAHPRLVDRAAAAGVSLRGGALRLLDPLSYLDMVATLGSARAVVTDSGGLQKEAYLLATVCTTLRPETEWPETLHAGWNMVLATPPRDLNAIVLRPAPTERPTAPFGDGHASEKIVTALDRWAT